MDALELVRTEIKKEKTKTLRKTQEKYKQSLKEVSVIFLTCSY
jgi:hypothetical protein